MNVIRKVFSDSAFTAFRSVFSLARGIILIPLITKLLGEGSYGVWVTILAIIGLINSVGGMHLHGSLIRYESQETKNNQTFSDILFLTFIVGFFLSVFVIIAGSFINLSEIFREEISNEFSLVIVISIIMISNKVFQININLPRAKGQVKIYDIALIVRDLLETLLLTAVFLMGGGIITALTGLAAFGIFMNLVILALIFMRLPVPSPNPTNFAQYIRYGIPMIPKGISDQLLQNTDKYLLIYFIGPTAVGIYAVAGGISRPLVKLTAIFNPTLYPTISQAWDNGDFNRISNLYSTIFRFYSILAIPATIGLVLLSESLLTILSTSTIAQDGKYLVPIFIVGYFLKGYDNTIRYILTAAERTDIIGGSVVISVVVNILLNLLLIPEFGIFGAAIATLISHSLLFGIILHYSFAEITVNIPWSTIVRSSLSTSIMGLSLLLIDLEISPYTKLVIYPGIGAVIYFSVLLLIGEFSKSNMCYVINKIFNMIDTIKRRYGHNDNP